MNLIVPVFGYSCERAWTRVSLMKVAEVIKKVEAAGWVLTRISGSHRHYKHPTKAGLVTISGNLHAEMPKGTLNNVLRQAGLK